MMTDNIICIMVVGDIVIWWNWPRTCWVSCRLKMVPFIRKQPRKICRGTFMLKRNGKYYFMWSEGGWTGPDYCVAYAIADSPFGPFKKEKAKILQRDPNIGTGAGHHSSCKRAGEDEWYIIYHRHPLVKRMETLVWPALTVCTLIKMEK